MREILFRGKSLDFGDWLCGYIRQYESGKVTICDFETKQLWFVDPSTVGQFTGLTDKNGKKIFEGDIIVIRNCREHPVLVKFIEFSWQCVIPNVDAYIHYRHRLENNDTKYEVIGNIHDNPELIGGNDNA